MAFVFLSGGTGMASKKTLNAWTLVALGVEPSDDRLRNDDWDLFSARLGVRAAGSVQVGMLDGCLRGAVA